MAPDWLQPGVEVVYWEEGVDGYQNVHLTTITKVDETLVWVEWDSAFVLVETLTMPGTGPIPVIAHPNSPEGKAALKAGTAL
ncbi:hypothetical protein [Saccharopolyspora taberi]|uniref:Uncharacterized protein n=1 Tax=Saccharopolyspora taberi TaxID=60895 RepID=A0ABN3V151_9PSEU